MGSRDAGGAAWEAVSVGVPPCLDGAALSEGPLSVTPRLLWGESPKSSKLHTPSLTAVLAPMPSPPARGGLPWLGWRLELPRPWRGRAGGVGARLFPVSQLSVMRFSGEEPRWKVFGFLKPVCPLAWLHPESWPGPQMLPDGLGDVQVCGLGPINQGGLPTGGSWCPLPGRGGAGVCGLLAAW